MRAACAAAIAFALLCGCASPPSSVAEASCRRYQRLTTWHRFKEAVFEYEYACANLEMGDKRHQQQMPEPSLHVLFRNVPSWMDMESLIALAEDSNLRMAPAAHDWLAILLDKPASTNTLELAKYYRDNRNRLWYEGRPGIGRFKLMPENTVMAGVSVGGSAGGIPGDDPLSVSQASYRRFVQLCREERYREAAIEYQYGLRNYRYACAAIGTSPAKAGSAGPLRQRLRRPGNIGNLLEVARHVKDYPALEESLRMCLSPHIPKPGLTLREMVAAYESRK